MQTAAEAAAPTDRPASPIATRRRVRVACAFGTRPEIIKFFPLIREFESRADAFDLVTISTSQHVELLNPFLALFGIRPTYALNAMAAGQSLNALIARIVERVDPVLDESKPDLVLVQGDTATAFAVAVACWNRGVPIGHVEAGLRTESADNPFPEEMYRRLIDRMATLHFAATDGNVANLLAEGVAPERIFRTGNTIVDALHHILKTSLTSPTVSKLIDEIADRRFIVLTVHRRETTNEELAAHLRALGVFLSANPGYALVFPVHYSPRIREAANAILGGVANALLIEPLDYADFIQLLSRAWLVVSDSGGIQEEAPTLGKRLLILRRNTERPEVVDLGIARLIGGDHAALLAALEGLALDDRWIAGADGRANPFGSGDSAARIVGAVAEYFASSRANEAAYQ